jgi:hypothetical protein
MILVWYFLSLAQVNNFMSMLEYSVGFTNNLWTEYSDRNYLHHPAFRMVMAIEQVQSTKTWYTAISLYIFHKQFTFNSSAKDHLCLLDCVILHSFPSCPQHCLKCINTSQLFHLTGREVNVKCTISDILKMLTCSKRFVPHTHTRICVHYTVSLQLLIEQLSSESLILNNW